MTTGYGRFDKAVQKANLWLGELEDALGLENREQSYSLLRAVLHTLRDKLPAVEAVQLGAQLPTLLRGVYYDGWHFAAKHERTASMDDFVRHVMDAMSPTMPRHPRLAVTEVLILLNRHVSAGEIEDVRRCLPEAIRSHWPAPALAS